MFRRSKVRKEEKLKDTPKEKLKKEKNPSPIVGETINIEAFRRLQLHDTKPYDLEAVVNKAKAVAQWGRERERNYMGMAMAFVVGITGMIVFLMALPKILSALGI